MHNNLSTARTNILLGLGFLCSCSPVSHPDIAARASSIATTATGAQSSPHAQPQAPQVLAPTWILPGDFSPDTNLHHLQDRFGIDQVRVQEIPGAEGESLRGVLLFPDDPSRRATLYFQDPRNLLGLAMVSISDENSRWKLASGLGIGTSLSELRTINGKPFTFSGFDWDYGGTIIDWRGGTLGPASGDAVFARIQLRMPQGDAGDRSYPQGDSQFSSDDPRWKNLGITVGGFSVGFPGEDDL